MDAFRVRSHWLLSCGLLCYSAVALAQVTLYADPAQSGESVTFAVGGKKLKFTSLGENVASSMTVAPNWHVHACLGGKGNPAECKSFSGGSYNFSDRYNDSIKSVFIERHRAAKRGRFGNLIATRSAPIWAAAGPNHEVLFFKIGVNRRLEMYHGDGTLSRLVKPPYDWFCTGLALDATTGDVIMAGGNNDDVQKSARFSWETRDWTMMEDMMAPSYYGSTIAMPNGTIIHMLGSLFGGVNVKFQSDFPEILDPGQMAWRQTPMNLSPLYQGSPKEYNSNWFPYIFIISDGTAVHVGPIPSMHRLDFATDTVTFIGERGGGDVHRHWSSTVMYDAKGLIMVTGGTRGPRSAFETLSGAALVDATDPNTIVTSFAEPMAFSRAFHCLVVLPSGDVAVTGGMGNGRTYTGKQPRRQTEVWNRETGKWQVSASSPVRRSYHSSSLLMSDGTVFTGGGQASDGGADGNQDNIIFFQPAYLFNSDGTVAERPTIISGPSSITVGGSRATLEIMDPSGLPINRITAVRCGTSNHQLNLDSRFLDLTAEGLHVPLSSTTHEIMAFPNSNVMLPGPWMIFAFNSKGVPSKAIMVKVVYGEVMDPVPSALSAVQPQADPLPEPSTSSER